MTQDKSYKEPFTLPEGRVINHSLFVQDIYTDAKGVEGKPTYKVEIAFDPAQIWPGEGAALVEGERYLIDRILDAADEMWGSGTSERNDLVIPILTGDKLAAKREAKGKAGDAYKGKLVIRANTMFNLNGEQGPGGVAVYGPDVKPISPAQSAEIYQGCFGHAAVSLDTYMARTPNGDDVPALTIYLKAFQKTKDGDRLVSQADASGLFQNHAGGNTSSDAAPAASGRRARR